MLKKTKIIIGAIAFCLIIGIIILVTAVSSGPNNGGLFTNVEILGNTNVHPWDTPTNAETSNNAYATSSPYVERDYSDGITHYLNVTNFIFSIPSTATIDGISVDIERYASEGGIPGQSSIMDYSVKIVQSGAITGDDKNYTGGNWPITDTYRTYGGATDLWGLTWTPTQINADNFGVAISAKDVSGGVDPGTAYIDHIRITIYYTEATGENCWSYGTYGYYIPKGCTCYVTGNAQILNLSSAYCWSG